MPSEIYHSRANLAFYEGEWEQSESAEQQDLDEARRTGSLDTVEGRLDFLAAICAVRGNLAKAEVLVQEALELSCIEEDTRLSFQLGHRTLLALIYANTSRAADAHEQLERCREIIGNAENWRGLVGVVAQPEVVVAAAEGKCEEAGTQFERAVQIFQRYRVPFEQAEACILGGGP